MLVLQRKAVDEKSTYNKMEAIFQSSRELGLEFHAGHISNIMSCVIIFHFFDKTDFEFLKKSVLHSIPEPLESFRRNLELCGIKLVLALSCLSVIEERYPESIIDSR